MAKNFKLSGREITGLVCLVLIVTGITAVSLLLKRCEPAPPPQDFRENVLLADTVSENEKSSERNSRMKKSTRKKSSSGKKSRKEKAPQRQTVDPFSDTIPTTY